MRRDKSVNVGSALLEVRGDMLGSLAKHPQNKIKHDKSPVYVHRICLLKVDYKSLSFFFDLFFPSRQRKTRKQTNKKNLAVHDSGWSVGGSCEMTRVWNCKNKWQHPWLWLKPLLKKIISGPIRQPLPSTHHAPRLPQINKSSKEKGHPKRGSPPPPPSL